MAKKQALKPGEKVLFIITGVFILCAIIGYIILEIYRLNLDRPLFNNRVHYNFSEEGKHGSDVYGASRCNSCHRVLGNGTNNGNDLDGVGSKRSLGWLVDFLANPEEIYPMRTFDHGAFPKEASYVSKMSEKDRHAIAVFLSELKVSQGSSMSPLPPKGESKFIDDMVEAWAPKEWKTKYKDIRETERYVQPGESENLNDQ